jgi:hypothetical protein
MGAYFVRPVYGETVGFFIRNAFPPNVSSDSGNQAGLPLSLHTTVFR